MYKLKKNEYRIVLIITDVFDIHKDYYEVHTRDNVVTIKDKTSVEIECEMKKLGYKLVRTNRIKLK